MVQLLEWLLVEEKYTNFKPSLFQMFFLLWYTMLSKLVQLVKTLRFVGLERVSSNYNSIMVL